MANVHVVFELTMPNAASWNGKWSEASKGHYVFKSFSPADFRDKWKDKAVGSWRYDWPDGWGAEIRSRVILGDEMKRLKRANAGFCGYSWMVDNILSHGFPQNIEVKNGAV